MKIFKIFFKKFQNYYNIFFKFMDNCGNNRVRLKIK